MAGVLIPTRPDCRRITNVTANYQNIKPREIRRLELVTLQKILDKQKIYRAAVYEELLKRNAMRNVGKRAIKRANDNYREAVKALREKYMRRIGK